MTNCIFLSDLHGKVEKYKKLFDYILANKPHAIFIGGDILPSSGYHSYDEDEHNDFILDFIITQFENLKEKLGTDYPKVFLIMGNDDPKCEESKIIQGEKLGLWTYMHNRKVQWLDYIVYGYANVPPTPFLLKDWERYDVSRYVDPGCVHPTDGRRTIEDEADIEYDTIQNDLMKLTNDDNLERAIMLFHAPPYKTNLDRAALDGMTFDHVPLDVHVGSIALQRFIEERQPMLTLHGHIHESSSITGNWKDSINKTFMFSGCYDKRELAIIHFNPEKLDSAERILI